MAETHFRIGADKVDSCAKVTLRHVADLDVPVVTLDGELLRQWTLASTRRYQPNGLPGYGGGSMYDDRRRPRDDPEQRVGVADHDAGEQRSALLLLHRFADDGTQFVLDGASTPVASPRPSERGDAVQGPSAPAPSGGAPPVAARPETPCSDDATSAPGH